MKTEDCQGRGDRQGDRETELSPEISQLWAHLPVDTHFRLNFPAAVINKENSHQGFVQSHSSLIKPREGSFVFCLSPL